MLEFKDLGRSVTEMEYAVRGPIVIRAQELEREGKEIIYCNIGNPQALKQRPLTYIRQVMALCEYPDLLKEANLFPSDTREVATMILKESRHGLGAYSESAGMRFVREAVAKFISDRDGINSDPNSIFITDGASKGAQSILRMLISDPHDGILIPIPQYPLYSATITAFGAHQIGYHLDEQNEWKLNEKKLKAALEKAQSHGIRAKAIVVINPGNPTGSVLDEKNISMILEFAQKNHLSIIADEVYQENIYREGDRFTSFAQLLTQKKITDVSLFSLHSCSKGFLGECGHRGGYLECRNLPKDVMDQILKLQSVSLCSNVPGQVLTYLMVAPPKVGSPSHTLYQEEKKHILSELKTKAKLLADGLNQIPGITSNAVTGAMYAFPQIKIPEGMTDMDYCMKLLEETGICVVPGSGFGQEEGTFHFRTTILPPREKLQEVISKLRSFHLKQASRP